MSVAIWVDMEIWESRIEIFKKGSDIRVNRDMRIIDADVLRIVVISRYES